MTIEELISEIEKLSVVELNELTKAIQGKWDIDPAAMGPAMMVAGGAMPGAEAPEAEQTEFDLIAGIAAIEKTLKQFAFPFEFGIGVRRFQEACNEEFEPLLA